MSSAPPKTMIPTLAELPLVLDTPRLRLRPQAASDADAFHPYVTDPELTTMVTWPTHTNIEETRAWITTSAERLAAGTDVVWTIEHAGVPVGCIGLHGITWAVRAVRFDRGEIGYWLGRPHWGRGLMSEATTAVMRWSFETLGLHKIVISCFAGNVGSRRVIEKSGFRYLCRMEDDVWRDGRWHAHLKYELTAAEWSTGAR